MTDKFRNSVSMAQIASPSYERAVSGGLMQATITDREEKIVTFSSGDKVVEFINCSYLGFDQHEEIVKAYKGSDSKWGASFCAARSRLSIKPNRELEERLSTFFKGRVIVFPSVTSTHMSVMPLIASGILIDEHTPPKVQLIFDRLAHSSMQYLKPILAQEAVVKTIPHNDIESLKELVQQGDRYGLTSVYVADGIYSMGGNCPLREIKSLAKKMGFYIYLDDAHGTSILGTDGRGSIEQFFTEIEDHLFLTFSMSKGFGVGGGGIALSNRKRESLVRNFGQVYAFSAPLEYSTINACLKSLEIHQTLELRNRQKALIGNVAYFDEILEFNLPFSPIRMIEVGNESEAISFAQFLLKRGHFVSVVFFPIVPQGKAQIRICISGTHSQNQIRSLSDDIKIYRKTNGNAVWTSN